ncbi:hypothetical protein [Microcoleus sp. EPA2]|uniref:hypothetical protein n=1 Tax=Microcoleus sp. EPA2 TaxID=2841654 RepID=UPI00312B8439
MTSEANTTDYEIAVERVVGFLQQFDRAHFDLACHAAFPLVITPDLLYQIWLRFVPKAPWTAVARVLLSRLCREVGYELYEMDIAVRNLLLTELKDNEDFNQDKPRLEELADFLTSYVKQQFAGDNPHTKNLAQGQYWTALAYTKPEQLSRELLEAINFRLQEKNWKELFRLSSLIETFAEPLQKFSPLLITYVRGIERLTCGDKISAEELFRRLPGQKRYIEINGVNVPLLNRVYLSKFGQGNSSLTVYAFHLRNSINQGLQPTVPAAPRLWEQLVDLGNALNILELQTLRQKLICYEGDRYFPEAEDFWGAEYLTLLQNNEPSLHFQVPPQPGGLELQGLLCPFRLHDTYAIDLTLFSQDALTLPQLNYLNPQNAILQNIHASLGQTLLLFCQPLEIQEDNYQALADACVAQLFPGENSIDLVDTGSLLGNPIFEYESGIANPDNKLHILVWFKCQDMNANNMDRVAEILLHLLWFRHKILYVYQQSRWCVKQAQKISGNYDEYQSNFHQISATPNRRSNLINLHAKLQQLELDYTNYLDDLEEHEKTIAMNETNYKTYLEKLENFSFTKLSFCQEFLRFGKKLQRQIQVDRESLGTGGDRLQSLKATVGESIATEPIASEPPSEIYPQLPKIYPRLRQALSDCAQFQSHDRLFNFFDANEPLKPWRDDLPEVINNRAERAERVIGFLVDQKRSDSQENVLLILLRLLKDQIDPIKPLYQTLSGLLQELNPLLSGSQKNSILYLNRSEKMAQSPYEETILDFIYVAQKQPELFTAEDRADFAQLVATLPDDLEEISNAIALWCDTRPHILDAIFDLPVEELDSLRAAGGRNTPLTGKEAKDAIENTVRESIPPPQPKSSPQKPG